MKLHELSPAPGSVRDVNELAAAMVPDRVRPPVRATRARRPRAGHGMRPGFEGGQMPLQSVSRSGFCQYLCDPLYRCQRGGSSSAFEDGAVVDVDALKKAAGLVKKPATV